jgi:transposase
MARGRPKAELTLSESEQAQLSSIAASRSMPAALVARARLVLAAAAGHNNRAIAERYALTQATVGKWCRRFLKHRIPGLYDELRSGRPRSIDEERVAGLIRKTLDKKPKDGSTHWSVRSAAVESKISKSSVHRYFQLFGVKPHLTESFKLSTDAFFVEKLSDVFGLYLNPPDNALVLSVDEKSQCQALERTQPMLPLGLGYVEGDAVCRPGRAGWLGDCAMQAAPPASGISRLPAHHRGERTEEPGYPSDRGQLQHPQTCQGQSLARRSTTLAHPLHAYLQFLAQSGRAIFRTNYR